MTAHKAQLQNLKRKVLEELCKRSGKKSGGSGPYFQQPKMAKIFYLQCINLGINNSIHSRTGAVQTRQRVNCHSL